MKSERIAMAALCFIALAALPWGLSGCEKKTVSSSKETTVKTKETPEGTVKTTETETKKVEKEPPK